MAEISKFNVGGTVYDFQDKVSQYGNRNLLKKTGGMIFTSDDWSPWYTPTKNESNSCTGRSRDFYFPKDTKIGDIFIFSYEIEWTKFTPGIGGTYSAPWIQFYANGSWGSGIPQPFDYRNVKNPVSTAESTNNAGTKKVIVSMTITTAEQITANWYSNFRTDYSDGTGKFRIRRYQLELGTKPTDWTPAPQDLVTVSNEQLNFFG
jgi:hypothetical protein